MGLKLENVVPWGRSMQEYIRMFNLAPKEMKLMILDCAAGPASFNAEMSAAGYKVISCDPVYQFTAEEIERRIQETYESIIEGVKANRNSYIWKEIQSPEELGQVGMKELCIVSSNTSSRASSRGAMCQMSCLLCHSTLVNLT